MACCQEVVAVDGPAASERAPLANCWPISWSYIYFDTGLMYRAVTWLALDCGTPSLTGTAVTALAETVDIDVLPPTVADGRQSTVLVNGQDVTWALREPRINATNVSPVAAYGGVRAQW